jgi:hypothetical protein
MLAAFLCADGKMLSVNARCLIAAIVSLAMLSGGCCGPCATPCFLIEKEKGVDNKPPPTKPTSSVNRESENSN